MTSSKKVIVLVFLYGGQHFRFDTYEDTAHDCLSQYRKFIRAKTVRSEDWDKFCDDNGGAPWVSYFGKKFRSVRPEDIIGGNDPYGEIDWIVDFSHVSAMQIFSEEELTSHSSEEEKKKAEAQ